MAAQGDGGSGGQEGPWPRWADRRRQMDHVLPYLARIECRAGDQLVAYGAGMQVDAHHVLTCFHVAHPQEPDAADYLASPPEVQRWVYFAGLAEPVEAQVGPGDAGADLSLLRLRVARPGVRAALHDHHGEPWLGAAQVWHLEGVGANAKLACRELEITKDSYTAVGDQRQSSVYRFGTVAGTSGAPVFACDDDLPLFMGVVKIGGEGAATGSCVAADRVRSFLAKYQIELPVYSKKLGRRAQQCLVDGFDPHIPAHVRSYVSRHVGLPLGGHDCCHIGVTPLLDLGRESAPRHAGEELLVPQVTDPQKIPSILADLSDRLKLPLRLPLQEEFEALCRAGTAQSHVLGRPPMRDDYLDPDDELRVPPDTAAEWVLSKGQLQLALFRDGAAHVFPDVAALRATVGLSRVALRTVVCRPGERGAAERGAAERGAVERGAGSAGHE